MEINLPKTTNCLRRTNPPRMLGPEHPQWTGFDSGVAIGTKYGSWRVLSSEFIRKDGFRYIACLCEECGKSFEVSWDNLKTSKTTRCNPCGRKKARQTRNLAKWGRPLLDADDLILQVRWDAIKRRCGDPKCRGYPNYGGRGIKLSEEFLSDVAFVNYAKTLPSYVSPLSRKLTLDRIDPNGDYERGNLRFLTHAEQMRNLQRTRHIEYQGAIYDARTFCEKFLSRYRPHTVVRLVKRGMPVEEILRKDREDKWVGRRWATCV